MAITKIHPIKSTLSLAIDYITSDEKTDEQILISSDGCSPSTAHLQFMNTREINDTRGTVLARHLIQSFVPGEVSPEKAHEIGLALAKEVLNVNTNMYYQPMWIATIFTIILFLIMLIGKQENAINLTSEVTIESDTKVTISPRKTT